MRVDRKPLSTTVDHGRTGSRQVIHTYTLPVTLVSQVRVARLRIITHIIDTQQLITACLPPHTYPLFFYSDWTDTHTRLPLPPERSLRLFMFLFFLLASFF